MWVMSAIAGLMYGTQYFQAADKPLYNTGLDIMIGVVAAGLVSVGLQELIYYFYNKEAVRFNKGVEEEKDRRSLYVM